MLESAGYMLQDVQLARTIMAEPQQTMMHYFSKISTAEYLCQAKEQAAADQETREIERVRERAC